MNNRITKEKNKSNRNLKISKNSPQIETPKTRIDDFETIRSTKDLEDLLTLSKNHGKYKGEEGVLYRFLNRLLELLIANNMKPVRFYQSELATDWGITRQYLNNVTAHLKALGIITKTYRDAKTDEEKEQRMYEPVTFSVTKMMRDPKHEKTLVKLFACLAPIAFSFFCYPSSFSKYRERYLQHLEKKTDLYHINKEHIFIKKEEDLCKKETINGYDYTPLENTAPPNVQNNTNSAPKLANRSGFVMDEVRSLYERLQRGNRNGLENPTPGQEARDVRSVLELMMQCKKFEVVEESYEKDTPAEQFRGKRY